MRLMHSTCTPNDLLIRAAIETNPNRERVLAVIIKSKKALSPKIILDKLKRTRSFDKVTLYRILDLLVDKKILRRIAAHDGSARYEIICTEHHPIHAHFTCRLCGEIECLEDFSMKRLMQAVKLKNNAKYEAIDLRFEGVCGICRT